jgi:ribosome-associated toxin RatA of RatAB toxin-antitoxin module
MVDLVMRSSTRYNSSQMFSLVNDVANYQEFLPGCKKSTIISQNEHEIIAELTVTLGLITQVFATKNTLSYPHQIKMSKLYGPFNKLDGAWGFENTPQGCIISLQLNYEFNNKLLAHALTPAFNILTKSMLNAFINRAQQVYGNNTNEH